MPQGGLELFTGIFLPSSDHDLGGAARPSQPLDAAPLFGARLSILPFPQAGVEGELAFANSSTEDGKHASLWHTRGHLLVQLPTTVVTPFILAGVGQLRLTSESLGNDRDLAAHFGAGLKRVIARDFTVRLDLRDNVSESAFADGSLAHHAEVLLSFGLALRLPADRRPTDEATAKEPSP